MSGDEQLVLQREKLGAVESYLRGKSLPGALAEEVKKFYKQESSESHITMSEVFENLSYSLQLEVASYVSGDQLQKCDLFRNCTDQLLDNLRVVLRDEHFASEEYLFRLHDLCHSFVYIACLKRCGWPLLPTMSPVHCQIKAVVRMICDSLRRAVLGPYCTTVSLQANSTVNRDL